MLISGTCFLRKSITTEFFVTPPTTITLPGLTFLRRSSTFSAIIEDSPAVTSDFFTPLFKAWVQSDLQNTEHLPDTLNGSASFAISITSSNPKFIRLIC